MEGEGASPRLSLVSEQKEKKKIFFFVINTLLWPPQKNPVLKK